MKTDRKEIHRFVKEADLVLVGIGEEFECRQLLEQDQDYLRVREMLRQMKQEWMLPYVDASWLQDRLGNKVQESLNQLRRILEGKNYFIVSTCMSDFLKSAGFRTDRIVEPCGTYCKLQCVNGCEGSLETAEDSLLEQIREAIDGRRAWEELEFPKCQACGDKKVFNTLYAEQYLEQGYLPMWELYRKWLQGTINRKVCIMELGVGMKYPQIIRWPFEKTAYLNQKAIFVRVNENLYQLTPELSDKGYSVAENAVDFLTGEKSYGSNH